MPCRPGSSCLCRCHYTTCLSCDRAARSNCDAEFHSDCSFLAELHGTQQPIDHRALLLCSPPRTPTPRVQPRGSAETLIVQQVSTPPGGEDTSPVCFWLIICKALIHFVKNPFRKPWETGNKFAVGWRGEARVLTSVRMLAGFMCYKL